MQPTEQVCIVSLYHTKVMTTVCLASAANVFRNGLLDGGVGPYVVPTFRGKARRDALDLGIYVPTALGTSPELKSIGGLHVASWQR